MKRILYLCCSSLLLAGVLQSVAASGLHKKLPPCEPGYQWVEEKCYVDVECLVCKMVPDVKKTKKVVYSTKDDPFCIQHTGKPGWIKLSDFLPKHCKDGLCHDDCKEGLCNKESCPTCRGPYSRKLLVKKEITVEEPITKCVVEKEVRQACYTVLKKVPCSSAPACETLPTSSAPVTPAPVVTSPPPAEIVAPPESKKLPK